MSLSEDLQAIHDSGDVGYAVEGCAEKAKALEDNLLEIILCLESTYSHSPEGRAYVARIKSIVNGEPCP